jgi:hypothetical protein
MLSIAGDVRTGTRLLGHALAAITDTGNLSKVTMEIYSNTTLQHHHHYVRHNTM